MAVSMENGHTQFGEEDDEVFYTQDRPQHSHSSERPRNVSREDSRVKTIDRYGFLIDSQYIKCGLSQAVPKDVAQKREKKWLEMIYNWDFWMSKRFATVRKRCRKGIPESLRGRAWQYLSCAHKLQEDNKKMFKIYLTQRIASKQEIEIKNDLHRTFPNHGMFAEDGGLGQKHLYEVLRAYIAYNPKEGFCQAHAPVASVLLMHLPQEQAFWCLVAMLQDYLPNYYSGQLEEVAKDGVILLKLLKTVHPKLHKRLKEAHIDSVMFMVEWFMCLYSRDLPWPSVLRIWDIFFCEGVKILFRIALVLLKHCTAHLPKVPREEYELLACLKTKNMPPAILEADFLIEEAYRLPIKDRDLMKEHKKLEKRSSQKKR
ncbi:TBC1 domain family member 10A-like [Watersipora subatra]|uniref:TBC1 domain family member 10A-like n=1 Tax=Watersipora subatra TaxID=2589382 RepID=UPI00355BA980